MSAIRKWVWQGVSSLAMLFAVCGASAFPAVAEPHVAIVEMDMPILPGTYEYLQESMEKGKADGAKLLIVKLDTPGGMLDTTQQIIQLFFQSEIPVAVYVAPSGATATSAGVFVTLAAHIAAMAPGTTIGAAHPVLGDGKDIEGDMRAKVENAAISMVKSIAEQRGRNLEWAEKSVRTSDSITEKEALKTKVIDVVAEDVTDLLKQIKGKVIRLNGVTSSIPDLSSLPQVAYEMSFRQKAVNVLANPNVAALLWLGATTGISIELYNPGAILPGVVGVICLILALAVSQVIPVSQGAVLLLVVGAMLIGLELFIPSGILGVGGVIAIVLGALYLVDSSLAPGLGVDPLLIGTIAGGLGLIMLYIVSMAVRVMRQTPSTGVEALIGQTAEVVQTFSGLGKVFVNGETWSAEMGEGIAEKGEKVTVVSMKPGLTLEVRKLPTR